MIIKNTILLFVLCLQVTAVFASPIIRYMPSNISGNQWQCEYIVSNDSDYEISAFTIKFDHSFYGSIQNVSSSEINDQWDPLVWQPNSFLSINGVYDCLALAGNGIVFDETVSGFIVQFEWYGAGVPGSQSFDIIDPSDYTFSLYSGNTIYVPEPFVFGVLSIGAVSILKRRHR